MKLILFMVMSLDGIVAINELKDIREYSSKEDHEFFIREASACDAAIMGRFSFNEGISCRRKYLLTHEKPVDLPEDTVRLEGDVSQIYRRIQEDGNKRVALLAGPRTNREFFQKGLVDQIFLTVEPVMIGKGLHFLEGDGLLSFWRLSASIRLNEKGTVVHHYVREDRQGMSPARSMGGAASAEHSDPNREAAGVEPLSGRTRENNYQEGEPEKEDSNLDRELDGSRFERILLHPVFRDIMDRLEAREKDRIFCRHGFTHLMDTARVMYILNLEEGLGLSKDVIYGAGLLHDIGRLRQYEEGVDHDVAGPPIAEEILGECGYRQDEIELILFAISAHRVDLQKRGDDRENLAYLLYRADKGARACFRCSARQECHWPEERKNKVLIR
ncbi:MAG: dihydrofolate reductase family protein [Lachnospiraceae bacterium]|nr:dihydrofolate reductase family protein [Lachnospiraceae bacterium]